MKLPSGWVFRLKPNRKGTAFTVYEDELILCKDCEFYTEEERWCRRIGLCGAFDQNGYCSHAERRRWLKG